MNDLPEIVPQALMLVSDFGVNTPRSRIKPPATFLATSTTCLLREGKIWIVAVWDIPQGATADFIALTTPDAACREKTFQEDWPVCNLVGYPQQHMVCTTPSPKH